MQRRLGYDVALICENGHIINRLALREPLRNTNFCDKCGAKTIDTCPACATKIRGLNLDSRVINTGAIQPPYYCHDCGVPYPWTETAIMTALEYATEVDSLSEEERNQLKSSIEDLVKDSPRTQLAALRFKKLAVKMGSSATSALRDILVDVMSEAAKKALMG